MNNSKEMFETPALQFRKREISFFSACFDLDPPSCSGCHPIWSRADCSDWEGKKEGRIIVAGLDNEISQMYEMETISKKNFGLMSNL